MSAFLSNKFLKYRQLGLSPRLSRFLDDDEARCRACGYSLRGLPAGRPCPECGYSRSGPGRSNQHADALLSGDAGDRRAMLIGLSMIAASLLALPAVHMALFINLVFMPVPWGQYYLPVVLAIAAAWALGVLLVTPQRMDQLHPNRKWLRVSARCTQPLWIIALGLMLIASVGGPSSAAIGQWGGLLRLPAGIGSIITIAYLIMLTDDAQLEPIGRRMTLALWILPFASIILWAVPATVFWVVLISVTAIWALWGGCLLVLAWGVLAMQRQVAWAQWITLAAGQREQRVAQVRRMLENRALSSVRPVRPAPSADIGVSDRANPARITHSQVHQ